MDDADAEVWAGLGTAFVIFALVWLLIKFLPPDSKTAPARRTSRVPVMAKPRRPTVGAVRPIPRRVIRLHAQTPGQSQHEYNVGDRSGTRASALIKVA